MASWCSLGLITQDYTHLWEDALFFAEKAVRCKCAQQGWEEATYARASVMFAVAAFESSCNHLFNTKDISKNRGVINGIKNQIRKTNPEYKAENDSYLQNVKPYIQGRNNFVHAKIPQEKLFIPSDYAIENALVLLKTYTHLEELMKQPHEGWVQNKQDSFSALNQHG